eukprot:gene8802-11902_t
MNSNKKTARIAGLLYLIVVMSGFFSLMYVPGKLIVWEDAAVTFKNITDKEILFRLGIVSSLICYVAFLFLPLVLYKLLSPTNKTHAMAMVILAIVSVPISFINIGHKFDVLTLISKASYLTAFDVNHLPAQVMLQLEAYNNGIQIVSIFWGLWLFPFGYLVFKSNILPKVLGVFLMLGCVGYLINFFGDFLFPIYSNSGISSYVSIPSAIGEIGTCLWLLIIGAKN